MNDFNIVKELIKDLETAPTGRVKDNLTIGTLKEQMSDEFIKTIARHLATDYSTRLTNGRFLNTHSH